VTSEPSQPRPRHRPVDSDFEADARLAAAWKNHTRYADLAREQGLQAIEVKRAIDRHRKRTKR